MRRRHLLLSTAALAASARRRARAQTTPMVGVGFLHIGTAGLLQREIAALRSGLAEMGLVEGRSVALETRWADGAYDRLPVLAKALVTRRPGVIVTGGGSQVMRALRQVSASIPVVFVTAGDPVAEGLVASLARPVGEVTGVAMLGYEITAKRFALLHEAVPRAMHVAFLCNPDNPRYAVERHEVEAAAGNDGIRVQVVTAIAELDFAAAFELMAGNRAEALLVSIDGFFDSRRRLLIELAARYRIPAVYPYRDSPEAGGLMSYGSSRADAYRLAGHYAGRILGGAKPADLPVIQAARFELVVNLRTARDLGIALPASLLAQADEVIE